jgi:hypothetical protein
MTASPMRHTCHVQITSLLEDQSCDSSMSCLSGQLTQPGGAFAQILACLHDQSGGDCRITEFAKRAGEVRPPRKGHRESIFNLLCLYSPSQQQGRDIVINMPAACPTGIATRRTWKSIMASVRQHLTHSGPIAVAAFRARAIPCLLAEEEADVLQRGWTS